MSVLDISAQTNKLILNKKRYMAVMAVMLIAPWIVAILGAVAIRFFDEAGQYYRHGFMEEYEKASSIFEAFYRFALAYGGLLMIILFILGVIFFIITVINIMAKRKGQETSIVKPLILWICSGGCMMGTLILIFLSQHLRMARECRSDTISRRKRFRTDIRVIYRSP